MNLQDLLAEFGTRSGLGALTLNAAGVCRLVFDGTLVVDVEQGPSGREAHLVAPVGTLHPDAGGGIMAKLLDANLMGRRTGGAALALDVLTNEVVLCRTLPLDGLSYQAFEGVLEAFVGALETWTNELAEDDGEVAAATAVPAASAGEPVTILRL